MHIDQRVDRDTVSPHLVERLDQLGPHDDCLIGRLLEFDHAVADQPGERRIVVDQALGIGQRHPLGLLGRPVARDGILQAQHITDVLALLPRAEHLVDMRDVVAPVQHRGDQSQPGQMRVVEQRDPADPQRWVQQSPVAIHPDVSGGRVGQPCELLDPVFAGGRRAVRLDGGVEQLGHRRLDDVARSAPDLPWGPAQTGEDRRDGAGRRPGLLARHQAEELIATRASRAATS